MSLTKLSVNLNKFALVRNARGDNNPDILDIAKKCLDYGVHGITVHPRPDGRHITTDDVLFLSDFLANKDPEFNIEGYPSNTFLTLMEKIKPNQVTLVPDPPEALTSSFGWDIKTQQLFLTDIIQRLQSHQIRVSIFLDPLLERVEGLEDIKPDRVELYTYDYAHHYHQNREQAIKPYIEVAAAITNLGIGLNAGHDLDLTNLNYLIEQVPSIKEVSIGHALVCDCFEHGLETTVLKYLEQLYLSDKIPVK